MRVCRQSHTLSSYLFKLPLDTAALSAVITFLLHVITSHLIFPSLQLIQNRFGLGSDVQFGGIVNQKYYVRSIDKPLARVVEGKQTLNLLTNLQNPRYLDDIHLTDSVAVDQLAELFIYILHTFFLLATWAIVVEV